MTIEDLALASKNYDPESYMGKKEFARFILDNGFELSRGKYY